MADISKPGANPVVAALLCLIFHLGHLLINGQQRKWLYIVIAWFVGSLLCGLPGLVVAVLSIIDAYQTAERLQKGESIPENEYTFVPLFKIIKMVDSTATCSAAK
jgi:hypothetical protein